MKKNISKDLIFKEVADEIIFVGDFDKLYEVDDDPWHQSGSNDLMKQYYDLSRNRLYHLIDKIGLKSGKLLECGCGLGYVANAINLKFSQFNVHGLDISQKAVVDAKNNFPDITFFQGDVRSLDSLNNIISNKFDVIIINQMLWYIVEEFDSVILNLSKFLDTKGYLIISNAFMKNQKYGKLKIDGFHGLFKILYGFNTFKLIDCSYLDNNLRLSDGLFLLQKV